MLRILIARIARRGKKESTSAKDVALRFHLVVQQVLMKIFTGN